MPTTKQQRRRALELLEASIDGCTEAIMLAYGFQIELLIELINAGFATTSIERMVAGGRRRGRSRRAGSSPSRCDVSAWPRARRRTILTGKRDLGGSYKA